MGEKSEKKVNIKGIIVEVIALSIVSLIIQSLTLIFNFDSAKIEIIQSLNSSGDYDVFIGVRNFEQNEYIENITIEITKSINIRDVKISTGNIQYNDNIFEIKQISPKTTESICFVSEKELTDNEVKIIKNGEKLRIENLNYETAVNANMIMFMLMFITLYAILLFIQRYFVEKNLIEKQNVIKAEYSATRGKINMFEKEVEIHRNEIEKAQELLLYSYVEIKDLTKENDFYRKLILEILNDNEKISSEQIQKKITDTLKTYTTEDEFAKEYEKLKFVANKIQDLKGKQNI